MLVVLLIGVIVRRRYWLWFSFPLYLTANLTSNFLIVLWPERFYRWDFWQAKEIALNLLRFAMALELAFRTFQAFPGAMATLRRFLFLVLVVTYIAVLAVPTGEADYTTFVGQLQPRVVNGTIWLFTAIAALILWYRLPVHPFHKAVLLGFVPYLLVFTVAMNTLGSLGWERGLYMNYASQGAYILVVAHWTYAAWRTDPVMENGFAPTRPARQTA